LFEMEDEIHQVCPIVWWHVWDNYPYPEFNQAFYEATDLLNCHSHLTYSMVSEHFPEKTNFVPHSLPPDMFFKMKDEEISAFKTQLLGEDRSDHFVGIWVNRNAKRKRPNDVLESWKIFLDKLELTKGHRKATLIMHTEPTDNEGPNLFKVTELMGIENNVFFSRDRLDFEKMNVLYNISDFCLNISYAEGFGLATLEAMMTGTPIVAAKTGGLTRQVVNHKTKTQNGVALDIELKSLVGSQTVPYIYEDYVSNKSVAMGIMKLFRMKPEKRKDLSKKVLKYVSEEFGYQKTIDLWHDTMLETLEKFKSERKNWEKIEF